MQMETTSVTTAASASQASNVLFEPEIYRPQPVDEHMSDDDDKQSVSTYAGHQSAIVSNYKSDLDPSLF